MKTKYLRKKLVFRKVTVASLNHGQMGVVLGGKDAIPTQGECETDDCGTSVECNFTFESPCSMPGNVCAVSDLVSNCDGCASSDPSSI